jgi:hypothetical protein
MRMLAALRALMLWPGAGSRLRGMSGERLTLTHALVRFRRAAIPPSL